MRGFAEDMKRMLRAACLVALLPGAAALAQDELPDDEQEEQTLEQAGGDVPAAPPEPAPAAMAPQERVALTPPEGVMPAVRRGFHVETDVGVFFTLGGLGNYSNAQTYLQLGVGYDMGDKLSLGAHFGLGANAANCFGGLNPNTGRCAGSENFTLSFIDGSAAYLVTLSERLYLTPKVLAGWTVMDPAPSSLGQAGQGEGTPLQQAVGAPNVGAGVGVEYATFMDHFSIGADLAFRFVVGPNIPTFAIFPRVKYTF